MQYKEQQREDVRETNWPKSADSRNVSMGKKQKTMYQIHYLTVIPESAKSLDFSVIKWWNIKGLL